MQAKAPATINDSIHHAATQVESARSTTANAGFVDNRPAALVQRKLHEMINQSAIVQRQKMQMSAMNGSPRLVSQRRKAAASFGGAIKRIVEPSQDSPQEIPSPLQRVPSKDKKILPEKSPFAHKNAPGAAPVQRAIASNHDFDNGNLSIDMQPGRRMTYDEAYGEEGLIIFQPAEDSTHAEVIDLVQTVKSVQQQADIVWTDDEAIREAWKGDDGRFVDRSGADTNLRREEDDPDVSNTYNASLRAEGGDYFAGAQRHRIGNGQDFRPVDIQPGYSRDGDHKNAELWDHPSTQDPTTFSFETEVVASGGDVDGEETWGSVRWSFQTTQNPQPQADPEWGVANETVAFANATSQSHKAAKNRFDQVMGNQGLISPEHVATTKGRFEAAATREAARVEIDAIKARVDEYLASLPAGADGATWRARFEAIKTDLDNFVAGIEHPVAAPAALVGDAWGDDLPVANAVENAVAPIAVNPGGAPLANDNVPEHWDD